MGPTSERPTPTPARPVRRWWAESAYGAGLLLALLLLLRQGVVFFGFPEGSDWETYISNTAYIWHGDWPDVIYQDWRKPLHAYLVGLLGEPSSYIWAAQVVTTASVVAMVLAAGLMGRALASRSAGVVSALSVAALTTLEPASRWVNHYPLLAGTGALALAFGAAALRWRHAGWALLAGLFAGLCFAVDSRGLVALVAVGLMVVGALVSLRAKPRRAVALGVAACLGLGLATAVDQGLQRRYTPDLLQLGAQLDDQRQVILDHYAQVGGAPDALAQACRLDEPTAISTLELPCAAALGAENHRRMRAEGAQPPLVFALLLLVALVPGRRGWRDSLGSLAVFGCSAGALAAGMAWVVYWDRYGLQLTVPLAVLAPVALARVAGWVEARWPLGRPGWGSWAGAAAALLVASLVWPGWPLGASTGAGPAPGASEQHPGGADGRVQLAAWVRANVGPDDRVFDCAGSSLFQLLLPLRLQLSRAPWHTPSCRAWSRVPLPADGRQWFVTLEPSPGMEDRFALPPAWMSAQGWERQPVELAPVPGVGTLHLWGRPPAGDSGPRGTSPG